MEENRIITKRTGNLLKENETLRESLTKANQTIKLLRLEGKLLLDELYSIRHKEKSDHLFLNRSSLDKTEETSLLSKDEMDQIQQRILKRMVSQSVTAAKRKKTSEQVVFRKNTKVSYDDEGIPILPLSLGITTIHCLGTVVIDRPAFHSKRYIWPVGYKSSRVYASIVNPTTQSTYYCRIGDGTDAPKFEVWSEELPDRIFSAATPTGAWSSVIKLANEIRNKKDTSNSVSGPDYFGISNPIVAKLIEELPGANQCVNYEGTSKEHSKLQED